MRNYGLRNDELVTVPASRDFRPRKLEPLPRRRFLVTFEKDTFTQFLSPTALLNDNSLNGAALLLQTHLLHRNVDAANRVAILSTHDLVRARYAVSDEDLWRNTKRTEYWTRDVWILPIHRPEAHHWVLCVVYLQEKQLHLFDSFADQRPWHAESKVRRIA